MSKPDFEIPENLLDKHLAIEKKMEVQNGEVKNEQHRVTMVGSAYITQWHPAVESALKQAGEFVEKQQAA